MSQPPTWGDARSLQELVAADLTREGVVFHHEQDLYRTTGRHLQSGGMGAVYCVERHARAGGGAVEQVVGKTFHAQYLSQLRTDEITHRDHQRNMVALERLAAIGHPHLLPTYVSAPIADNHLIITPRKTGTLLEAVASGQLSARRRVKLLLQALRGLEAMHQARVLHRDFTLRNILIDGSERSAFLFDFDLALGLDEIGRATYKDYYQGRIFGSPGYSVAPETIEPGLMDSAITARLDIYAVGGALYSLFTDQLPCGPTDDMWALLVRIADGLVIRGQSQVVYPDTVPGVLRPVIETCLERDPGNRFGTVGLVIDAIKERMNELPGSSEDTFHSSITVAPVDRIARLRSVHSSRRDQSVTAAVIDIVDQALSRYGYQVQRSLGRVKKWPIFLAAPVPELLASGQFPDANTYPKIVTAVNASQLADPRGTIELWLSRYLPILRTVRQGLLTSLFRAEYDQWSGHLFLFSEYVGDPRFGADLEHLELGLGEALGMGFLVARQVGCLHEQGLAHNNVRASALLLKGLRDTREVYPAMVGLVEPSLSRTDMVDDVRKLSALILSWIRPQRLEALDQRVRPNIDALRARLAAMGYDERLAPGIDELIALVANGLSALDENFRILREHGGDLQAYTLLRVSHPLYGKLWK
jgi:serine/threonine protein kinase